MDIKELHSLIFYPFFVCLFVFLSQERVKLRLVVKGISPFGKKTILRHSIHI